MRLTAMIFAASLFISANAQAVTMVNFDFSASKPYTFSFDDDHFGSYTAQFIIETTRSPDKPAPFTLTYNIHQSPDTRYCDDDIIPCQPDLNYSFTYTGVASKTSQSIYHDFYLGTTSASRSNSLTFSGESDTIYRVSSFNIFSRESRQSMELGITSPQALPEPATWGTMILGFGAIGGTLRRKRSAAAKLA